MRHIVGIDEAGRGPVAGPVAVGIAVFPKTFDFFELKDIRDSKKHTAKQRDIIYEYLCEKREKGKLNFFVAFTTSRLIDRDGIVLSVKRALARGLRKMNVGADAKVLLDGGLCAPDMFIDQKTIIRGDSTERAISFASIAAKVERDRLMERMAREYPDYGFEKHKGYGTRKHIQAIRHHGLTDLHRRSFLGRLPV